MPTGHLFRWQHQKLPTKKSIGHCRHITPCWSAVLTTHEESCRQFTVPCMTQRADVEEEDVRTRTSASESRFIVGIEKMSPQAVPEPQVYQLLLLFFLPLLHGQYFARLAYCRSCTHASSFKI